MSELILEPSQRAHMLDLHQHGLNAALEGKYGLAVTYLKLLLELISPTTWPMLYHDAALALSTVYISLEDDHIRENAREAVFWHEEAQSVKLPLAPLWGEMPHPLTPSPF